jgi:hypothetical protein
MHHIGLLPSGSVVSVGGPSELTVALEHQRLYGDRIRVSRLEEPGDGRSTFQ